MWRRFSKWGVTLFGVLLLAWGAAAMWNGWDVIQVERGWSLFLGGASAVAGGAVTFALGLVIGRLDRLIAAATPAPDAPKRGESGTGAPPPPKPAKTAASTVSGAFASAPPDTKASPARPADMKTAAPKNEKDQSVEVEAPGPAPFDPDTELVEVDRYESGETTYVMFSDGSVEVRNAAGARRYASLGELRAEAAQQI